MVRLLCALVIAGSLLLAPGNASAPVRAVAHCDVETVEHFRDVTVYFGTVAVAGGGPSQDHLQLTDHISNNVQNGVLANFGDDRVTDHLGPWVDLTIGEMEWILATPEGLDAEGALRAAFAAFAAAQGGTLLFDSPINHGTHQYPTALWSTVEPAPGCPPYDIRFIDHEGYARVTYIELNASVVDLPTSGEQCKRGGWRAYTNANGQRLFRNQGDCVSFVATKGKNPPAGS